MLCVYSVVANITPPPPQIHAVQLYVSVLFHKITTCLWANIVLYTVGSLNQGGY